jgi:hypothetical protein
MGLELRIHWVHAARFAELANYLYLDRSHKDLGVLT